MARDYSYAGYTHQGQEVTGTVTAPDEAAARDQLRAGGLIVTEVVPANGGLASKQIHLTPKKVKVADLAWMSRNLATTQEAGLPVLRSLGMLARQRPDDKIGEILADIEERVGEGEPLGSAFRTHVEHLGELCCALVEAGEQSGALDQAFGKIADFTEGQMKMRRQIIGAVSYPAAVTALAGLLFIAVLLFVVPTFENLYASMGDAKLPAPTLLLLKLSQYAKVLIPASIVGALIGRKVVKNLRKQEVWRYRFDLLKMRVPVFGRLIRSTALARINSSFASLMVSGVPLLESMQLTSNISNNAVFQRDLTNAAEQVEQGRTLATAFTSSQEFPEIMIQLVAVGDETGQLPALLARYAKTLEQEVETIIESLTSLLEPLMIVVLGGGVGAMLVALYVPMFNIINLIQ